jgi:hypothetical protein
MCLLITKNQNTPALGDQWLEDFYLSNSDGLGVMYAKNNQLIINKILPKSAAELIEFYRSEVDGKKCAVHFRMRTHGDIDLLNCHPYEVLNKIDHGVDLWLMHNGVLATGNKADPSKSDTYHYIKDYLKPMLAKNPDLAFTDQFRSMVGSHIGSGNKFVLMDNKGRQSTINQSSGVFWAGMWLSNTYAWSAPADTSKQWNKNHKLWKKQAQSEITKYKNKFSKYGYFDDYEDDLYYNAYSNKSINVIKDPYLISDEDIWEIEQCMDDIQYYGFSKACDISWDLIEDFIYTNRLHDFFDLYDQLISYEITEDIFINLLNNPTQYKKQSITTQGSLL